MCNHGTCMKIKVLTAQKIDSAGYNNVEARGSADRSSEIIQMAVINIYLRVIETY